MPAIKPIKEQPKLTAGQVRIGINPITWSNDDLPELGGETSLETCLSEGKQAGYAGFELGNKFPRQPEALLAALKPYGLDVVSGWHSGLLLEHGLDAEIKSITPHLELLAKTGSNALVYAEVTGSVQGMIKTPLSHRPKLPDTKWQQFGADMTKLGDYCLEHAGVRIVYHHHMGTVVETEEETNRLMDETGESVSLLLDTGHMAFAGGDHLRLYEKNKKRVRHVHCKDVRKTILDDMKNRDESFLNSVLAGTFAVPGDGMIDYLPLLAALKKDGYAGWLVVEAEQDPAIAPSYQEAVKGYNYLKATAEKVGLKVI